MSRQERAEHAITESLNGRQLNESAEQISREAQRGLHERDPHQTNLNYMAYNEMAARAHLPKLELVNEHATTHGRSHEAVNQHRSRVSEVTLIHPTEHAHELPSKPTPAPPSHEAPPAPSVLEFMQQTIPWGTI